MNRSSLINARTRLREHFPASFSKCLPEVANYGKCISINEPKLKKDDCIKEFEELKKCFDKNMKSMRKG